MIELCANFKDVGSYYAPLIQTIVKIILSVILMVSTLTALGQTFTKVDVDEYCKDIATKHELGKLIEIKLAKETACGGSLSGFYEEDNLVEMSSFAKTDFETIHRIYFIRGAELVAATDNRRRPTVNVDEFCRTNKTKDGKCNFEGIPYERVVTTIHFLSPPVAIQTVNGGKQAVLSENDWIIDKIKGCGKLMMKELSK